MQVLGSHPRVLTEPRNVKSGGSFLRGLEWSVYAAFIHETISHCGAVLKSVLVALDRSAISESEIVMLRSLNLSDQSKVILTHVISPERDRRRGATVRGDGSSRTRMSSQAIVKVKTE